MNKVLILSYHFPPQDIIAAYRGKALADHLPSFGYRLTIVTHHWEDPDRKEIAFEEDEERTVIRLPFPKNRKPLDDQGAFFRKFRVAGCMVQGHLQPELKETYRLYRDFLVEHLKENAYDLLLGIFSPHFALKLTHEMAERFGVPYALDLRDLWSHRIVHQYYHPTLREKIEDLITEYYWQKWFSGALFFSITSNVWKNKVQEVTNVKGIEVKNGYEEELFQGVNAPTCEGFRIVHTGSIYNHQKLEIFLQGAQMFYEKDCPASFSIEFIGADRKAYSNSPTSFTKDPEERIGRNLSREIFTITSRIPKKAAIHKMQEAQLLLFPTFPDAPGRHSGKIFDYLGAGRPILAFPHDNGVVDELLEDTQAGTILDTPEEVEAHLTQCYREWKEKGVCAYKGIPERIENYSRREQVRVFADAVKKYLPEQ
jgi:hypothetical protein